MVRTVLESPTVSGRNVLLFDSDFWVCTPPGVFDGPGTKTSNFLFRANILVL